MTVEYRLLGPVQVWANGRQIDLKRRQERLLLAILLLEPGKVVPFERLVELLWPDDKPGNPKRALQVYVSRLRGLLAEVDPVLEVKGGAQGYAVLGPGGRTDSEVFAAQVNAAKATADPGQRRTILLEALALWRGPALADVTSEEVRRRLSVDLEGDYWSAQELRLETELELGRHQQLLPELADLIAAQPLREGVAAAYMLALYRSGRQADAMAVYSDLVRRLSDEHGTKPGAEVSELHVSILRQDGALDLKSKDEVPRELPPEAGPIPGREALLDELTTELSRNRPHGVPAVICLYGAAERSALAIRLAHRLAAAYPDGQLFAQLRDPTGAAVQPQSALERLLRSLGADELPESVEERASLLRSRLAGKSVLLVFEDAVDAGQLRPLLPADGRCTVIVTSTLPMLGLEDAVHRELQPLADGCNFNTVRDNLAQNGH